MLSTNQVIVSTDSSEFRDARSDGMLTYEKNDITLSVWNAIDEQVVVSFLLRVRYKIS